MKFRVSNDIVTLFKITDKNINYMLDYLLSAIDPYNCKKYFQVLKGLDFCGEQIDVEISDTNIGYVKSLFGEVSDKLIESLLWVSLLFQEG